LQRTLFIGCDATAAAVGYEIGKAHAKPVDVADAVRAFKLRGVPLAR
jgi:hypothetical protein